MQLRNKRTTDRLWRREVPLVYAEGSAEYRNGSGESCHCVKELSSNADLKCSKFVLTANYRSGVEAERGMSKTRKGLFKSGDSRLYGDRLVMENERNDIETRRDCGRIETSRFIHKYAQHSFSHRCARSMKIKLAGRYPRQWRGTSPSLWVARTFASARNQLAQTQHIITEAGCLRKGLAKETQNSVSRSVA